MTGIARGTTMNFLLHDTYNVEVSSATDTLRTIATFDVEIAVTPVALECDFALLLEISDKKCNRKLLNCHDHRISPSKSLLRKPVRH